MPELAFQTAGALAELVRTRAVGSRELLEHYAGRIARVNPSLGAVVTLDLERARRRADAADAALARGESWGPLHGLPITVKDTFETAGMRTTSGASDLAEHVPAADAVAVGRLVAAGAIPFGKTNVPLMAGDWQTYNAVFGTTNNPWDPTRTPGGSSGGAAAAVAADLTAFELGSDIAGSIRVPSGWCGVYGHKPTYGIVPVRGHIPGPPGTVSEVDLAVAGPIARSADDLAHLLDVLAGPTADRAAAWTLALPPSRRAALRDYRVAAWLDDPAFPVDPAVGDRLQAVVDALGRAGVRVHDRPFDVPLREINDTYARLLWPIIVGGFPAHVFDQLAEAAATMPEASPDGRFARYGTARHRDWIAANEARARLRERLAAFFRDVDVLLTPIAAVPAIPHDHREPFATRTIRVGGQERPYQDLVGWIALATATWHPATAAPAGRTRDGLPVGVQIVGPYLEDRTPIDFARRLADVAGGFEPPPVG